MKNYKKLVGKLVKIEFWDHAMGTPDPVRCMAIGQVTKVTDVAMSIRFWEVEEGMGEHNNEYLSILLSTIKTVSLLKEVK